MGKQDYGFRIYDGRPEDLKEYRDKYPTLVKYLAQPVESDIVGSKQIVDVCINFKSNLYKKIIKQNVTWGRDPIIKFVDEPIFDPKTDKTIEDIHSQKYKPGVIKKVIETLSKNVEGAKSIPNTPKSEKKD